MLPRSSQWILLCAVLCWQVPAQADEAQTADQVIAKYIEAIGGRAKLDSIKSIRLTGKNAFGGGMESATVIEVQRPNKLRVEFTFQGMTGVQAFDGETGWFIMPFMGKTDPEKMSPDQVKAVEEQADVTGPLVDYKKKGHQVELLGKEEFEGSETYKLKLTKKSGDIEYHYLDAEYFIPIKVKGKHKFQGADIEYEATYGNYNKVDGLLVAHSISRQGGPMGPSTMTFEKVELNVKFAADRFTMPEVKKEEPTTKPADVREADDKIKVDDKVKVDDKDKVQGKTKTPAEDKQKDKD